MGIYDYSVERPDGTGQCSRCPLMRKSGESGGDGNNAPQNR